MGNKPHVRSKKSHKDFARLRSLPVLPEVIGRLKRGDHAEDVASWLQNGGYIIDIKTSSLKRQLDRFQQKYGGAWGAVSATVAAPTGPSGAQQDAAMAERVAAATQLQDGFDALGELYWLAGKQRGVLEGRLALEEKMKLPVKSLDKAVDQYRVICHTIIDKERELGMRGEHNRPNEGTQVHETTINVQHNELNLSESALAALKDPDSRRKLIALAGRARTLARNADPEEALARRYGSHEHDHEPAEQSFQ